MRLFVQVGLLICYLTVGTSVGQEYKSLIYNYHKRALISLPKDLSKVRCQFWITSCPATDKDEQTFDEKYSLYNKSLYLQNIYKTNDECTKLDEAVCNKPIEMSIAYNVAFQRFELGYEMFYQKKQLGKISPSPYYKYYSLKKIRHPKNTTSRFFTTVTEIGTRMIRTVKLPKLRKSKMEFLWIPLVLVNIFKNEFQDVEYEIRKNNINPRPTCKDYSLGQEILLSANMHLLYSEDRQRKLFQEVTLSSLKSKSDPDEVLEGECTQKFICLTKWSLLPTDQFQFVSDSDLKCSNLTTIPLWKSTLEKIMEKLDLYLYALQKVSGQPLQILAGVNGVLSLPQSSKSELNIVLKGEKIQIVTPKIIYKMVTFKLENRWYGVLIVIHNGPNAPTDDRDFVCEDQSKVLGWEEIQYKTLRNEGPASKFIYVCEITNEILTKVGQTDINGEIFTPLSLLSFPKLNKENQVNFKIMKDKLYNEMLPISKPGEVLTLDDGLIERPIIYDNLDSTDDGDDAGSASDSNS